LTIVNRCPNRARPAVPQMGPVDFTHMGYDSAPAYPYLSAWSVIASVEAGQLEVVGWGRR